MEQISEEFARELIDNINVNSNAKEMLLKLWKQKGYIKQSREDKIRKKIDESRILGTKLKIVVKLQKELIEILDKKLEEK